MKPFTVVVMATSRDFDDLSEAKAWGQATSLEKTAPAFLYRRVEGALQKFWVYKQATGWRLAV